MINFLLLMIVPVLLSLGILFFFKGKETWKDALIQIGIVAVITAAGLGVAYYQGTTDTEVWNGQVTGKQRVEVSCRHSYQCNCYTTTDSKGNTTEHCSTCYEHRYDVDWDVSASTGENVRIDGVSRQGLVMPPRWGAAFVGEPFSSQHHFTNYIKANPKSVLLGQKGDMQKFGTLVPTSYPQVYDYYKVSHVYNMGVPNVDLTTWNWLISNANRALGPSKQVNLIVVLVKTDDPAYAYAFRDAWLGGKKNDAIILIGSLDGRKIEWADVISWTPRKDFAINIRERIMQDVDSLEKRDKIVGIIEEETALRFERLHMKQMEWLVRGYQPSGRAMLILFIIGLVASGLAAFISIQMHDGEYYYSRY
jgi:hypothetical protein